jgi:hypothetical protein
MAAERICCVVFPFRVLTHRKCAAVRYSKRLAAALPRRCNQELRSASFPLLAFACALHFGALLRRCGTSCMESALRFGTRNALHLSFLAGFTRPKAGELFGQHHQILDFRFVRD